MSRKLLVPIDGSDHSLLAIDIAAELANINNDKLILLNVVGRGDMPEALKQYAKVEHIEGPPEWQYEQLIASGVLRSGRDYAKKKGVKNIETMVRSGEPSTAIVETAEDNAVDMIVMGNRGLGAVRGLAFGSASRKVCHDAPCLVVTVR